MPIKHQLTSPTWLELPHETRAKLKDIFHIPQTGQRTFHQQNGIGKVTSDGHTHQDLAVITNEAMAEYLGEKANDDFWGTFERVLAKVEVPKAADTPPATGVAVPGSTYCDQCTSKGGRHLKSCPKYL